MPDEPTITLPWPRVQDVLRDAPEDAALGEFFRALSPSGARDVTLELGRTPGPVLLALLTSSALTLSQRSELAPFLEALEPRDVLDREVASPREFAALVLQLSQLGKRPNLEIHFNGRWYPMVVAAQHQSYATPFGTVRFCSLRVDFRIGRLAESRTWYLDDEDFVDEEKRRLRWPFGALLERFGLRTVRTDLAQYARKVAAADKLARESGRLLDAVGSVVTKHRHGWWQELTSDAYASRERPRRVVVEDELEVDKRENPWDRYRAEQHAIASLPHVRVFALDRKEYVYSDVDDLVPHAFDERAIERLVLPPETALVLQKVFAAGAGALFGDVIAGKHGGMVILANGPPGVGKTLTAEVFAEHAKRPLYVMAMGELGTSLAGIEDNLRRVFVRAARWNAILLLDEADVFMTGRDADLERSAIVSVFLTLLDYYQGILFLTTNRASVMDEAFRSRITLALDYPPLDRAARARIWSIMLAAAELELAGDPDRLAEIDVNGRQIRNLVRLLKTLHPEGRITEEDVVQVSRFVCR